MSSGLKHNTPRRPGGLFSCPPDRFPLKVSLAYIRIMNEPSPSSSGIPDYHMSCVHCVAKSPQSGYPASSFLAPCWMPRPMPWPWQSVRWSQGGLFPLVPVCGYRQVRRKTQKKWRKKSAKKRVCSTARGILGGAKTRTKKGTDEKKTQNPHQPERDDLHCMSTLWVNTSGLPVCRVCLGEQGTRWWWLS